MNTVNEKYCIESISSSSILYEIKVTADNRFLFAWKFIINSFVNYNMKKTTNTFTYATEVSI